MHDQNRVVDDRADEDDEAQHRQHVQLHVGHERVHDRQADEAARHRQRHAEHDGEGVDEVLEQRRQQQVGHQDGEQHARYEGVEKCVQLVGRALQLVVHVRGDRALLTQPVEHLVFGDADGLAERHAVRDLQAQLDRRLLIGAVDLRGRKCPLKASHVAQRHDVSVAADEGHVLHLLRPALVIGNAADHGEIDALAAVAVVADDHTVTADLPGRANDLRAEPGLPGAGLVRRDAHLRDALAEVGRIGVGE